MNKELEQEIKNTFGALQQTLSLFKQEQLDVVPFEGSWTPGQVAEHIVKFTAGVPQICSGLVQAAQRPANEKSAGIRHLFLDFSQKFPAPAFVMPTENKHDKTAMLRTFKKIETDFLELAAGKDLTPLCLALDLPVFGTLTQLEWLEFALVHTQRHVHQLQRIHHSLTGKPHDIH